MTRDPATEGLRAYVVGGAVRDALLGLSPGDHDWVVVGATPEQMVALGHELTQLGADWQAHAYGAASHAFTNSAANDAARGTMYDETTRNRAFRSMYGLFDELFGSI